MNDTLKSVEANYPAIASSLLGPLTELITLSHKHCEGDIERFLVLLVVGVRTTQHPDFAKLTHEQLVSGEIAVFPGLGTNVRSISASIGVPKETVRRKVSELIEAGWFVRQGHSLFLTGKACKEIAPVRASLERMAVRYFEIVSKLPAAA